MNKHPIPKHGPRFQIDEWVQSALRGELLAILENDWLDVCHIDRVTRSLDELRLLTGLPEREVPREQLRPGVALLHCVRYGEMSKATLDGLPDALLQVLGLDNQTGPHFLGPERWREVESRFHNQASYELGSAMRKASPENTAAIQQSPENSLSAPARKKWASGLTTLLRLDRAVSLVRRFFNRDRATPNTEVNDRLAQSHDGTALHEPAFKLSPGYPAVEHLTDEFPCDAAKQVLADVMKPHPWPFEHLVQRTGQVLPPKRTRYRPKSPPGARKNGTHGNGDEDDDANDIIA